MPAGKKPARRGAARRGSRGDDWIVLAGRFRERGPAPHGPPSDLWAAAVYADDGRTVAHAMDVRRDRAVRRAVTDALAGPRPARVFADVELLATGLLGRLGLDAEPTGRAHAAVAAGFAGMLREYGELAADDDRELDEVAATAEFLDAAGLALRALEGDRDRSPIAEVHPPRGEPRVALLRAGAEPAVITVAAEDAATLLRELDDGTRPSVATLSVSFVPERELDADTARAVRAAGWSADLLPEIRATDDASGPGGVTPEVLRELADAMRALVAAGAARAGRGGLAPGTVEIEWPGGGRATVTWHVEADDEDEARLH